MFRRRLYKAAIAAGSLLFIAAAPGSENMRPQADHLPASCTDSAALVRHAFDENGLCICIPGFDRAELPGAPLFALNKQAADFVSMYLKENGYFLTDVKKKSPSYFKTIETVFEQYELPAELKYLAVVESKLDTKAVSGAGAAGLWQLMPSAARSFGLKVNGKNDERKNMYKSTVAAAKCLRSLHKMFDDWLLTVAAYNCGPGGVLKAIKKSGSRDYWTLQNFLPLETRKHVKKFIALHYYFEGHGSLTTMTKKQTLSHIEAVASFVKKQQQIQQSDTVAVTADAAALIRR